MNIKGLKVGNRLGIAAGFDKNGQLVSELEDMGFGFIEVGTVTPKAQPGNPKPRIHRVESHEALVNSLGFNNKGVKKMASRLQKLSRKGALGINIGPNKSTSFAHLINDYLVCLEYVGSIADYITINISSPNTPELRNMHSPEYFKDLIAAIESERLKFKNNPKILIKLSPDEENETYYQLIELVNKSTIDGVIVSNTSVDQEIKDAAKVGYLAGGVSGKLIGDKSNKVLSLFKEKLDPKKIIVAVGGVFDVDSYNKKIDLGADLVQIYTGFIYEGPSLIKRIVQHGK